MPEKFGESADEIGLQLHVHVALQSTCTLKGHLNNFISNVLKVLSYTFFYNFFLFENYIFEFTFLNHEHT